MRQEFEMTREEMNKIIAINKEGEDHVMFFTAEPVSIIENK